MPIYPKTTKEIGIITTQEGSDDRIINADNNENNIKNHPKTIVS